MKQGLWHRLDVLGRSLSPLIITLLLVTAGFVPLQVPNIAPVIPSLALIGVYYWAVHRPDLMTIWSIFAIGLFQDLLSGGYVGVGILALLMVHLVVDTQRRYFARATFQGLWVMFAVVAAAAIYLMWLLNSILQGELLEVRPALFQFLTTVAVYPCLAWIFAQAQKILLK
ncbi:MAG: rod shape-determining protein MreD [Rhodospirillales bacterium]|nr:rod shape-determining protein MreD [Rhodospirillales bacterium]